jgi:hypothetical protein
LPQGEWLLEQPEAQVRRSSGTTWSYLLQVFEAGPRRRRAPAQEEARSVLGWLLMSVAGVAHGRSTMAATREARKWPRLLR